MGSNLTVSIKKGNVEIELGFVYLKSLVNCGLDFCLLLF